MTKTANMKKEFQKVIKEIRGGSRFPKAMMNDAQIRKNTATVNCGGEWLTYDRTKEIATGVMKNETFKAFLTKYNATATLETNSFHALQIRINY